jgi:hypothetical protein
MKEETSKPGGKPQRIRKAVNVTMHPATRERAKAMADKRHEPLSAFLSRLVNEEWERRNQDRPKDGNPGKGSAPVRYQISAATKGVAMNDRRKA